MINNFYNLEKLWFFWLFERENSSDIDYLMASIVYRTNQAFERKFYILARKWTNSSIHLEEFFGPWYGLFLMCVLLFLAKWWNFTHISLTAATQNHTIINQNELEKFYLSCWFQQVPSHYSISSMALEITDEVCNDIATKVMEKIKKYGTFDENGNITSLNGTSRLQRIEDRKWKWDTYLVW